MQVAFEKRKHHPSPSLYKIESKESLEFEHANNESFHLFDFLCEIRQGRDE
jgi:hypothetical protein